jgi:hypothetical protein
MMKNRKTNKAYVVKILYPKTNDDVYCALANGAMMQGTHKSRICFMVFFQSLKNSLFLMPQSV